MLQTVPSPEPRGLPLVGNLLAFRGGDLLGRLCDLHRRHGGTVRLRVGGNEAWSFAGAEAIDQVLTTKREIMRQGWNRATVGDDEVGIALGSPLSGDVAGEIYDAVEAAVYELELKAQRRETIDIGDAMMRLSLRVLARARFGVELGGDLDDAAWAFGVLAASQVEPLRSAPLLPARPSREHRRATAIAEAFAADVVAKAPGDKGLLRDGLIRLCLTSGASAAQTLTFLMYEMAGRPELRAEVRAEAMNFGRPDSPAAVERRLPMSGEIVSETLRLYPPAAVLARRPAVDCEIGGHPVTAGTLVLLVPFVTQRDRAYWPAGDAFAPDFERPLAKRIGHSGAFVPFGDAAELPLGEDFAMMQMRIAAGMLCDRLDWTLAGQGDPELAFNGILRPKTPIRVGLTLAA